MNMVEQQQYISAGLPHTGGLTGSHSLSEARSIAPAGTSAYPEVTPFSTVSSFNIPAPCDSSLLTPISTTSSPPLHQIRKLASQYPPPPSTPYTQVPTPPGSSKMYHQPWSNQFDMHNQNAQSGSPLNSQVQMASEFYMPEDRRTPNPPTEPYFGSFSVSEGTDSQSIHHQGPPSYYVPLEMSNQNSMMIREARHLPMESHARDGPHPSSLLAQPRSSQFPSVRRASTDDRSYTSRADTLRRSSSGSPRRRSATQGSTRVKKSRSSKRGGASLRNQADPGEEHKNCFGQEVPPPIKKGCPEEERCIFESRWRHRDKRGQDMWDSIQADFERRFGKKHGKEMLQMKFKRGRSKFYDWLDEDVKILQAAFKRYEKERYQTILNLFHEMGGSRNMLLSASDIEIKIVNDLKWEEAIYFDNDEFIRRRRRTIVKKRSTGRGEPGGDVVVGDDMLQISQTPHNEEEVINQVYAARRDRWDEDVASVNSEMMDSHLWENRAPMKMEPDSTTSHPIGGPCIRPVSVYHSASKAP
ncbi:hypothetical protein V8C35DRAFT_286806 [Trichoderma chlorosporum]